MKINLHLVKSFCFAISIILLSTRVYSEEAAPQTVSDAINNAIGKVEVPSTPKSIRKKFKLGEILFGEIAKYDNSKVIIMNPEGIKQLDGVVSIIFKIDKGRSIGLCDYVLEDNKGKQYPSVALKVDDGVFDGGAWEIIKEGEHRYSLLFFVNYPADNSNQTYKLKYVLIKNVKDEHDLELINIGDGNFTKPSAIDETVEIVVPPSNPTTPPIAPGTVIPPAEKGQPTTPIVPGATPATPTVPPVAAPVAGATPVVPSPAPATPATPNPAPSPAEKK